MKRSTEVHFFLLLNAVYNKRLSQVLLPLIHIYLSRRHITLCKIKILAENSQSGMMYLACSCNCTHLVNPLQTSRWKKVPIYQPGLVIDRGTARPFPFLFTYFWSTKHPTLQFPEKEFDNRLSNSIEVLQIYRARSVHLSLPIISQFIYR